MTGQAELSQKYHIRPKKLNIRVEDIDKRTSLEVFLLFAGMVPMSLLVANGSSTKRPCMQIPTSGSPGLVEQSK